MTREESKAEAMRRLRQDLEAFALDELVWDLGCNVPPYIRAAILFEFTRRGVSPEEAVRVHGRGRCRGSYRR